MSTSRALRGGFELTARRLPDKAAPRQSPEPYYAFVLLITKVEFLWSRMTLSDPNPKVCFFCR